MNGEVGLLVKPTELGIRNDEGRSGYYVWKPSWKIELTIEIIKTNSMERVNP